MGLSSAESIVHAATRLGLHLRARSSGGGSTTNRAMWGFSMSKITILKFNRATSGALAGYFSLKINKSGMIIHGCKFFEKYDEEKNDIRRWIAFPSKSYEKDGETKWAPIVEYEKKETMRAFNDATLEALDRYFEQHGDR